ncbi:MAG: hypothetical protein FJY85_04790 [Deltaproteobacteria bacterium]|nr:hypothetical protein [Deltaproteobacteria bacterium]
MIGQTATHLGDLILARRQFKQGLDLYDTQKKRMHRALQDPGVACLAYQAPVLWLLGFPDQATHASRKAVALARRLSHPFSLAYALTIAAVVSHFGRKPQQTLEYSQEACSLGSKHGMLYWSVTSRILRALAMEDLGQWPEGLAQVRKALASYVATGSKLMQPYWLAALAEVQAREGKVREALRMIDEAQAVTQATGERWSESVVLRLMGELLLSICSGNYAAGEACLIRALEAARNCHARSLELRAAMSLSRLWSQYSKKQEACTLLGQVYGTFTEGFEDPDLREARELLNQLK